MTCRRDVNALSEKCVREVEEPRQDWRGPDNAFCQGSDKALHRFLRYEYALNAASGGSKNIWRERLRQIIEYIRA
jgi:hypothetical protein